VPPRSRSPPTSVVVVRKPAPPPSLPPAPPPSLPSVGSPRTTWPSLPPAKHVQVNASLDPNHSSMTIVIPVGPSTQAVGVSVRSATALAANQAPVLDQMVLLDRNGFTIDEIVGLEGPQAG